jgi:hypothetical protein
MAHRTERQRAWHSLHRQLGRIPKPVEIDAELARRGTLGEQVGNNAGNNPGIPTDHYPTRGTIGRGGEGTVEGTTGERGGNNAAVPSGRTTRGSLEEEGGSEGGEFEDGYKTGVIDAANHSLDEIRRLAARFRAERGE